MKQSIADDRSCFDDPGEAMRISGKRILLTRLVRGGRFIVAVNVEAVIPPDDPTEPCLEAETVTLLKDVAEHAEQGDRRWLAQHGKVYELADQFATAN